MVRTNMNRRTFEPLASSIFMIGILDMLGFEMPGVAYIAAVVSSIAISMLVPRWDIKPVVRMLIMAGILGVSVLSAMVLPRGTHEGIGSSLFFVILGITSPIFWEMLLSLGHEKEASA